MDTRTVSGETIHILNPLRLTLLHYEHEMVDTLKLAGYSRVQVIPTTNGEGVTGATQRLRIMLASLIERVKLGFSMRGQTVIVVWPLFGYLDPWTLWSLCYSNRVFMVMHDPTPLRKAYGYSRISRRLFKWIVGMTNIQVVYHTALAMEVGVEMCGIAGVVVPHPMSAVNTDRPGISESAESRCTVRVLGQYKKTRAIAPLEHIAAQEADDLLLEVHGRGWPSVAGWQVSARFVPEAEFDMLIASSDCIVIPYDTFFQSGVAVRSLELGVPVVGPRHEHIVELYGSDWPGLVRDETDWHAAVLRAVATDAGKLEKRADDVRVKASHAWSEILDH